MHTHTHTHVHAHTRTLGAASSCCSLFSLLLLCRPPAVKRPLNDFAPPASLSFSLCVCKAFLCVCVAFQSFCIWHNNKTLYKHTSHTNTHTQSCVNISLFISDFSVCKSRNRRVCSLAWFPAVDRKCSLCFSGQLVQRLHSIGAYTQ